MPIRKSTILTLDEAIAAYEDHENIYSPSQRRMFREYALQLQRVELQQSQTIPNLLNAKGIQSELWLKVHQFIEDETFKLVTPELKQSIRDIETQLKESGAL